MLGPLKGPVGATSAGQPEWDNNEFKLMPPGCGLRLVGTCHKAFQKRPPAEEFQGMSRVWGLDAPALGVSPLHPYYSLGSAFA